MNKFNDFTIIENNSKIFFNDSVWFNNNSERFIIVGKVISNSKNSKYLCKFDDGSLDVFLSNCITSGRVKNKNTPNVYGNGFVGYGTHKTSINGKPTREYKLWNGVLQRVYSNNFKINNPKYKIAKVDTSWHNFQKFCDDIKFIENYENWKNDTNKRNIWELDKDFLSEKLCCDKIYSIKTCKFILNSNNSTIAREQQRNNKLNGKIIEAIRLSDNYCEDFISMTNFSKKYNLNISGISSCLSGNSKTHKGWIFRLKDGKLTDHKGE